MRNIEQGRRQRALIKQGRYYMEYLISSPRGKKGFMMDATGVRRHITKGRYSRLGHVVVPLLGCFKGKKDEKMNLIPAMNETYAGL